MNNLIASIKAQIIAQLKANPDITRITNKLIITILDGFRVLLEDNRTLNEKEKIILQSELSNYFVADLNYENDLVELERGEVIRDLDPKLHTPWDPIATNRFYWRKQREFLMKTLSKRNGDHDSSRIINSIDFETDEILRNMEDPARGKFDSRGLVLGYVQSGKTANFTALVSKAADAGYRFVIILAGIHDELRQQTQIRIDRELTGHNNLDLPGEFVEWNDLEENKRWYNITSAGYLDGKETGEFSGKGINKFSDVFLSRERPALAIIKKNVRIMDRLLKWIDNSSKEQRRNIPVMIIDDEADQASVDGNSTKSDTDPTKTNAFIRRILKRFERTAYIGYTATPFANVFIKHDKENEGLGDDLYPRNFIHSLPEPQGYFGTRKIFHDNLDRYFVLKVDDARNERKYLAENGTVTTHLISAIYFFILGIAIRNLRGQSDKPMSLMVNIDHRVNRMNRIGDAITEYMLKTLPKHFKQKDIEPAYVEFIKTSRELSNALGVTNEFPEKKDILREATKIIKDKIIEIKVLNSSKDDKLDYAKNPSMKVIAVGGNKLSRGLTLEGLMVTFYLRESKQYDTLLQMGRWFGYRKGYEDLVRIFTSKPLWQQFTNLAIVELEFRSDIKDMVKAEKTPKEFAISVKQILGLLPTAKNRLGAARLEGNYGGKQFSVTRIPLEHPNTIDDNTTYTKDLIASIHDYGPGFTKKDPKQEMSTLIAWDVPFKMTFTYLSKFNIAVKKDGTSLEFDKEDMLKYIKKNASTFQRWNVAVVSIGPNEDNRIINLYADLKIRAVNRARLKIGPENGSYNIKAISDKRDRSIDLSTDATDEYDGRVNPLLLIYFISRNSKPLHNTEKTSRINLYEGIQSSLHRDPVSYALILPPDSDGTGRFIQSI
jgi:hypothetical protein